MSSGQSDGGGFAKMDENQDHYQKIKNHAVLCLQYLFKSNSKVLFNYWQLLFPSFFTKGHSEFTPYLQSFSDKKAEYFDKVKPLILREPTIFYLLKAPENNAKLKSTISFMLSIMLESQFIQKWQG